MSISVMTALWRTCLYQGNTLNVLLAMADWAADDGGDIYPGIDLLAAKARASVRTTQIALRTFEADGVIEQIANARGGRGKITEYKINLERVQELQGLHEAEEGICDHCNAKRKSEEKRVQFRAQRVQASAGKGAVSRAKGAEARSRIDNNHQQPSNNLSNAPASAGEREIVSAVGKGGAERWPEFRSAVAETWPDGFPADDEAKARREFERLARIVDAAVVLRCARMHGEALRARKAQRSDAAGAFLFKKPSNWLRDGGWEGYAALPTASHAAVSKPPPTLSKDNRERLERSGLRHVEIDAWFAYADFAVASGQLKITAPTPFARNWIATHFAHRIARGWQREFGILDVIVNERRDAA